MRILIVDDSIVFRSQIKIALDGVPGLHVVGSASNGKIAVEKLEQETIDLVIMDVEMPEMSGLEALKEIRKRGHKTKVIMFSSLTKAGAETTLEALSNGAQDFVTKPSGEGLTIENAAQSIRATLIPKIQQFLLKDQARQEISAPKTGLSAPEPSAKKYQRYPIEKAMPSVIVIGSSTGGPAALEEVLRGLAGKRLRCPILITQHMPPVFTATLARRIQTLTGINCEEGKHMELMQKQIYIAPGDYHMSLALVDASYRIILDQNPPRNSVRPAVDFLFESAAELFGNRCVGTVLTGMGADGADGAVAIKNRDGGIIIQNKETCVVFGMPGAVYELGAYDMIQSLDEIGNLIKSLAT